MRKLAILAFDDFVMSSTVVYTTQALNEVLGTFDKLTIQAMCDSATGTNPSITVRMEHSGDQRSWVIKNASPEIPTTVITATSPSIIGGDTSLVGSMAFVRLAITLAGTTPTMHVKLWVTARDTVA